MPTPHSKSQWVGIPLKHVNQNSEGMLLLELMMTLSLSSLVSIAILSGTLLRLRNDALISNLYQTYMLGAFARWEAMATDQDTQIELTSANTLSVLQGSTSPLITLYLGRGVSSQINGVGKLGLKSSGTTQFSGTITLSTSTLSHQLSLGVGNGKWSLK